MTNDSGAERHDAQGLDDPLAVSVERAAQMIGVSGRHAWNEIKAGRLQTVRSGKRRLVTIETVRRYLGLDAPVPPPVEIKESKKREQKPRARRRRARKLV